MFVGVVCARAAMVGEEGDEDIDVDGAGDAVVASRHWLPPL